MATKIPGDRKRPAEASSHSKDDVHKQVYQEVERSRDLLPSLQKELKRLEGLRSKTQLLAHRLRGPKIYTQRSIKLLSMSRDDIDRLDKETCRHLLRSMKKYVPRLRTKISARDSEQPWLSSKIHLKVLSHSTKPTEDVFMNEWYDHLYIELMYMKELYLPVLLDEHKRLEGLISRGQNLADKLGSLKFFLEKSMNLFSLRKANIACADKKECRRLLHMTKLFVMGALIKGYPYRDVDVVWPPENLCAISVLLQQMNMKSKSDQAGPSLKFEAESSDNQCSGGGLPEGDWHHQAYHELVATRIISLKLDEAYSSAYRGCLCDMLARAFDEFLENSLEFLATSKSEMVSFSKEKCYNQMMLIKLFVVLTNESVSANQNSLQPHTTSSDPQTSEILSSSHQVLYPREEVSSHFMHRSQHQSSPNWRDWVYAELQGIRKKYSSELDESYRMMRGVCTQNPNLVKQRKVCNNIFSEDLGFLGYARVDLALVPKEECLSRLMRIREFLNCSKKFVSAEQYEEFLESCSYSTYEIQPGSWPYWRNEVYEEIRSKKTKFLYEVDVLCKEVHKLASQIPLLSTVSKELALCCDRPRFLFTMTRSELALCSKEEYEELVALVNKDLVKVEDILTGLQPSIGRKTGFSCDISLVLLEQPKNTFESAACGDGRN